MKKESLKTFFKKCGAYSLVLLILLLSGLFIYSTLKIQKMEKLTASAFDRMSSIEEYINIVNNDNDQSNDIPLNGNYNFDGQIELYGNIINGFNIYLVDGKVVSGIIKFEDYLAVISDSEVLEVVESNLVLSILDNPIINHTYNTDYKDTGAIAFDDLDGDLTNQIIKTGEVDVTKLGTYKITYSITNSNNKTITKTRTVNVIDNTKPIVKLNGNSNIVHTALTTYVDLGATATDDLDGDITSKILVLNNVDTNKPGIYTVSYYVIDASNNISETITRTVTVYTRSKPLISIKGTSLITHDVGTVYNDLGATAYDINDGTLKVTSAGQVDYNKVGVYKITYKSINSQNFTETKTRIVNVVDRVKPVISLNGDSKVVLEVGSDYTDQGAIASDNYDADITKLITVDSNVNKDIVGNYEVSFNVLDYNGNKAKTLVRKVFVVDIIKPAITLVGDATVTHEAKTTYTDLGATASDNYDGDITNLILLTNNVNIDKVGTYTVVYNIVDANGNVADEVTRTVNVVDTTEPVITLNGDATVNVEVGSDYTDLGATASDNYDGTVTNSIQTTTNVNTNLVGTYSVYYNVSDGSSNAATEVVRTVNVVDTTKPVITLNGDATVNVEAKTTYTDAGATASDSYQGNISTSIEVTNGVNINKVGTYTIKYNVSDSSGNAATEVVRTVNVVDTTKPVITLTGDASISHIRGTSYTDLGATASDTLDGNLTSSIVVENNVDADTTGKYTVTYTVTDANGNTATATRAVNVIIQVIYNYEYTGSSQTFTAAYDGKYVLEVWGAQGGNDIYYPTTHFGGYGGYTKGELTLTANTNLYVYVGSQGTGCLESTWNSSGGGGATDIRLVTGAWNNNSGLYSRIIVAGGGGGRHGKNYENQLHLGNNGGGLIAPTFTANGFTITGATQVDGGSSNYSYPAAVVPGAFGYAIANNMSNTCSAGGYNGGGAGADNWANSGAGGGWYGGCTSWSASSGGSSYVLTSTSVKPIGYTPTSDYYMTNTQVISGSSSMPAPVGENETGHTGNGYARITYIGE